MPVKLRISCLRYCHPVPLTSVIITCLGLPVKALMGSLPPGNVDGWHFRPSSRSAEGASNLHNAPSLWQKQQTVTEKTADYNAAFILIPLTLRDYVWAPACASESWTCWQAGYWWWKWALPLLLFSPLHANTYGISQWSHITVWQSVTFISLRMTQQPPQSLFKFSQKEKNCRNILHSSNSPISGVGGWVAPKKKKSRTHFLACRSKVSGCRNLKRIQSASFGYKCGSVMKQLRNTATCKSVHMFLVVSSVKLVSCDKSGSTHGYCQERRVPLIWWQGWMKGMMLRFRK